jgi:hypothetical protein
MKKKKEKKTPKETKPLLKDIKFKFIDKVGVELEGGWENRPEGYSIHTDSSVCCRGAIKGESRTDPKKSVNELFEEIKAKYPDDVDKSCGFHVHISLKPGYYPILMEEEFYKYFLKRMGILAKYLRNSGNDNDYKNFLHRYSGKNSYCTKKFEPKEQMSGSSERRTMLNFCSLKKHKTLECRLFPMFEKVSNARMAAYEYLDCVESYLATRKIESKPIEVSIVDEENELVWEAA